MLAALPGSQPHSLASKEFKMTDAIVQKKSKAKLRFLHFSDIHFGQEKNGAWIHDDVRREVLNDCKKVLSDKYIEDGADAIIVTGDVA
jgi:hypothetical protein